MLKLLDKFLKFLKTDRNTFFTYILTLITIYLVVDRTVEILFIIFTGIGVSYWNPFVYTAALACPVFAFLFCFGSKFVKSNKTKESFFHLYVISLYIITTSMLIQFLNSSILIGLMSLPGYKTIIMEFPELIKPPLSAIAIYAIFISAPKVFSFLFMGVNDTRSWQESIWDYGGIKLTSVTKGTGEYACEMPFSADKETGKKAIIPEESRFNQLLVVGPSGSGKTSLVFEPMMARDLEKKYFFKAIAKEMGFTALKTGIAVLNCPYNNEYLNENFSLTMISPVSSKEALYFAYMKKMIIGKLNNNILYKNLGLTSISPDYESTSHMIEVAKNFNFPYHLVDPNNADSIGINPFIYDNPLQTSQVITTVLKSMYQGTVENMEKSYVENTVFEAIENICVLLKVAFPILNDGDKDYLPNIEDIISILQNFDIAEKMCRTLEEKETLAKEYASQIYFFKTFFYKGSEKRPAMEKNMHYAVSVLQDLLKFPGVRNIICNRTNNLNYEKALEEGEITFLCTRRGDLGASIHKTFGLFFMLLMQNAILRRPGNEENRIPHFLYVDEFPEFLSTAIEPMFTLYRKYKVGIIICSQTLAQLGGVDEKYQRTIVANCVNKIAFGNTSPEESEWWNKEFGNVRHWKFSNSYDTEKEKYDPKLGNIEWAWKSKFAADKIRSLGFKSCAFKYKENTGGIFVGEGKLDFISPKYKEKKQDKLYNFEKFSHGIVENPDSKRRILPRFTSAEDTISDEEFDPIKTDTSDLKYLFDNDEAIIINLKKDKKE